MSIGLLAIAIAAVLGLVSIMGTSSRPEKQPADYSGIYKNIQVKEL